MKYLPLIASSLLILFTVQRSQAGEVPFAPAPSDDAAVWYLTAQNDLSTVYDEQVQILLGNDAFPQDASSKAKAIEAIQTQLTYIRRGASMDRCSWPVDLEKDGPYALLHHLGTMRLQADMLTNIAWINAEKPGGQDAAIADALAVMRMAKHTSADGTLISTLVQFGIDDKAIGVLSSNLHQFNRAQLQHLAQKLDAIPARRSTSEAMAGERMIVDWLGGLREEEGGVGVLKSMGELSDTSELQKALKGLDTQEQDKHVVAWLDELDAMYTQVADNLALPLDAFRKADAAFNEKLAKTDNFFAKMLLPAVGAAREREEQAKVSHAILRAMIAFRLKGEAAFNTLADPMDGKPFTFGKDDGYLTVNSRLINRHGVPVRLLFSPEAGKPLD